jgi:hypothetical protein
MVGAVVSKWPELRQFFPKENKEVYLPVDLPGNEQKILLQPDLLILSTGDLQKFVVPKEEHLHPLDLLFFHPRYMANRTEHIATENEFSLATMGQDQRHRTIGRGSTWLTGNFYLPPILQKCQMQQLAQDVQQSWLSFRGKVPDSLFTSLAPYGATVRYKKQGCFNAFYHEQRKRRCWCAQEEIYHLAVKLARQLLTRPGGKDMNLTLLPPCDRTGKCGEGSRYCGRDIKKVADHPLAIRTV